MGEQDAGIAEVHHQQPKTEVEGPIPGTGHQKHVEAQHEHRSAERHPDPVAAEAGLGPVHRQAHGGVDRNVDEPHQREHCADEGQRQAEFSCEIARQVNGGGDAKRPDGDSRAGEDQGSWQGDLTARRAGLGLRHRNWTPLKFAPSDQTLHCGS